MKSSLPLPTSERTRSLSQPLASLPPVGPRGLCLEIHIHGVISHRQRGPEAKILARLKKRARLYHGLATIR